MNSAIEMKKLDLITPENYGVNLQNQDFVDISLSSDNEVPSQKVDEWLSFKSTGSKSFSDSLVVMSTLLQSERKISTFIKSGSMVDSFVVSLPVQK